MNRDERNTLTTYVLPEEDGLMVDIIYGRLNLKSRFVAQDETRRRRISQW